MAFLLTNKEFCDPGLPEAEDFLNRSAPADRIESAKPTALQECAAINLQTKEKTESADTRKA